jgi:DNA polymerase-3 subunit beta
MTATVEALAFKKAMPVIKSLILSRTTIPLLQCVKITVKNSVMELEATNLDTGAKITMPANGDGVWCLNFDKLQAVLSAIPDGAMIGITGDTIATIQAGKIKATVRSFPADDFPDWTGGAAERPLLFTVGGDGFASALKRTVWSCDDIRIEIKGIHCKSFEGNAVVEATNGKSAVRLALAVKTEQQFGFIIPPDAVASIGAIAEKATEMRVCGNDRSISIEAGNTVFTTKLIDAQYPDMDRMIASQKSESQSSVFDVAQLEAALKSAASLDRTDGAIRLTAGNSGAFVTGFGESGEAFDVPVDCECIDEFEAWVKHTYLLGILANCGTETIQIQPSHLSIIVPDTGSGYSALVMTLRAKRHD